MKIALGADHGGWQVKELIKDWLEKDGYEVVDVGAIKEDLDDDYVDFARLAGKELDEHDGMRGVLFCRNGFGMVMTANKFKNVRCGFGFDEEAVRRGRLDDDINCLAIPSDYVSLEKVKEMVEIFLDTKFSDDERYSRRLAKLEELSNDCCKQKCCNK